MANEVVCHVYRYYNTSSRLYVRALKDDKPAFYLLFMDVGYFAGPINWRGVDYHIAPPDECLHLMVHAGMVNAALLSDPEIRAALASAAHLYVFDAAPSPVQIIAGTVTRLDTLPADV